MEHTHKSRVLKWILALAIVIVLNLFFTFAIRLGYKEPKYQDFCPDQQIQKPITDQTKCLEAGGQWTEYGPDHYKYAPREATVAPLAPEDRPKGYCNEFYTCQKEFEEANKLYNRNVFVILIILGILSLASGYAVGTSSAVSLGLSLGGILSLIIASMRYWSDMQDILRVIILGLALATLIWFGIKKFKD